MKVPQGWYLLGLLGTHVAFRVCARDPWCHSSACPNSPIFNSIPALKILHCLRYCGWYFSIEIG